ncbi:MAG TPA: NADPH:quinone reductase [Candidatus Dormibacteraeota bacterium]|nr:NADPH:quinone reductase [Candidatus Dormibacteraeota bacterium]
MKAIVYDRAGGPEVLRLVDRPVPEPGPGEVRVQVHVSGVNPTDWKRRRGLSEPFPEGVEQVPNQDGAGRIDAVGKGVDPSRIGQRVWLYEAAHRRPHGGTAQQWTTVPETQAVPLPDQASFELGASLGVPALTAHRALTLAAGGPTRLAPGALAGATVLVAGGAGAVGHMAIQLAGWAGARVITTVSGPEKVALAKAAGADHVVNYRAQDATRVIRELAPGGVDLVVEVAPAVNAALDIAVLKNNGTVAYYANEGGDALTLPVREVFSRNLDWHGLLLYTLPADAKANAVAAVSEAVASGALRVGEEAGLPLHRYPLERAAEAHAAVERRAVGKVLIDLPTG